MADESTYHDYLNNQREELDDKEMKDFLDQSAHAQVPPSKRKEEIWNNIERSTGKPNANVYMMVAASVAVLIVSWIVFLQPDALTSYATNIAEAKQITLPDGSLVDLSANSEVAFNANWDQRDVSLSGEAFFEVEKGESFTVKTELGNVRVLGTSFNVIAREQRLEVACKTGKVEVSVPSQNFKQIILPGDLVRLNLSTIEVSQTTVETIGSWKSGQFYFDAKPLSEVLDELERQFDISMTTEGIDGQYFTGYFTNQELATALTMICEPMDLTFAIRAGNEVEIRPRNAH